MNELTIETIQNSSINELTNLYKQGCSLNENPYDTKTMLGIETIASISIIALIAGVMITALFYYKLGKWEAKKLGWD